jgi:hypothetical protein
VADTSWHRDLVGVVSRIVLVRMAGMPFLGPTIGIAVAVVDVLSLQRGMALAFCKSEGSRIMRCGVNGWWQRCGQRYRNGEREAANLAVDPVRHHPVIVLLVPSQNVSTTG